MTGDALAVLVLLLVVMAEGLVGLILLKRQKARHAREKAELKRTMSVLYDTLNKMEKDYGPDAREKDVGRHHIQDGIFGDEMDATSE